MTTSVLHQGGQRMRVARRLVVARDGATCRRCGGPIDLTLSGLEPMGLTLGHIVDVADGGTDQLSNLGPEHRACNLAAVGSTPAATVASPPGFFAGRRSSRRTPRARNGAERGYLRDDANSTEGSS